jgi:hypothetical protein
MDDSMIERVARAMWALSLEPEHGDVWEGVSGKAWGDHYRDHARAAIEAIREPTGLMLAAAREVSSFRGIDPASIDAESKDMLSAMIDAALA